MSWFGTRRQPRYHSWRLRANPQVVEYAQPVLEAILDTVADAHASFPEGGLEVGGLLYGTGDRHLVRILDTRPIVCEHAYGPQFRLSETDHELLHARLTDQAPDPDLEGCVPVGWYVTRTGGEITLRDDDLQMHARHFPEQWQIALVFESEAGSPTAMGVFAAGNDGRLPVEPTYYASEVEPPAPQGANREEAADEFEPSGGEVSPVVEMPIARRDVAAKPVPSVRSWILWIAASLVVVACVVGVGVRYAEEVWAYGQTVKEYWTASPNPEVVTVFGLELAPAGEQLTIRWNGQAAALSGATAGVLTVVDGGDVTERPLTGPELLSGSMTYDRKSPNVLVTLRAPGTGGAALVETARFLAPGEATDPGVGDLQGEVDRLRIAVDQERKDHESLMESLRSVDSPGGTPPSPVPAVPAPGVSAPRNPPVLAEKTPAPPVPGLVEQRPPVTPGTGTASAGPPSTAPAGASAGVLIWTGMLEPGRPLRIQGDRPSTGSLSGLLPGVAVRISAYPAEFGASGLTLLSGDQRYADQLVLEEPAPKNSWNRITYKYDSAAASSLQIVDRPSADNGWQQLTLRALGRTASVIVIRWERVP